MATEVVKYNNEAWHYYSLINYEASKFYSIAFAENLDKSNKERKDAQNSQSNTQKIEEEKLIHKK
jgi:hypothetical protein